MTEEIRNENPMDEVMVTMNAAMNQYERKIIRMRMSAGMKERVKKGFWIGGGRVPWGYYYDRNDGILHPDPEQAEMVRKAYELYVDGYSCDKIAKIVGFKGERIVIQLLKRKSNIGMIEYKGEVYKGLHEPIVSEELFYKVQECMEMRHTNSYIAAYHILTGLCYCGRCGARMRYQKWGKYHKIVCYSQYKNGKDYLIKDPNCDNEKVKASWVETEVEICFKKFAINLDEKQKETDNREIIQESINKCNSKIKKLYHLYAENDNDNLLEVIKEEERKLKDLKKELSMEVDKKSKNNTNLKEIKKVADIWDLLDNKEKNKTLKMCVEKVVIDGEDIDIYFNYL